MYDLTLSVGLGTFRPVETERIEDHPMHGEKYFLPPETKTILRNPEIKKLAIGTTCVRAIEHYLGTEDTKPTQSTEAEADLLFDHHIIFAESIIYLPTFIYPVPA